MTISCYTSLNMPMRKEDISYIWTPDEQHRLRAISKNRKHVTLLIEIDVVIGQCLPSTVCSILSNLCLKPRSQWCVSVRVYVYDDRVRQNQRTSNALCGVYIRPSNVPVYLLDSKMSGTLLTARPAGRW